MGQVKAFPRGKAPSDADEKPFIAINWSLEEIRRVIPPHLFERSTLRGMSYLARDVVMCVGAVYLASRIQPAISYLQAAGLVGPWAASVLKWALWGTYWWFQSLIFTGLWGLGHECGHRGFAPSADLCDAVGFVVHSLLLTPYYSWKISHHKHHMGHGSMERDELWIPATRSELELPPPDDAGELDYLDHFGDSPIYNLAKLLGVHFFAFQVYLFTNLSGRKDYPAGTSHYNPYCALFLPSQRHLIIASDVGILTTLLILSRVPAVTAVKYFWIPWFGLSHWVIFMTFLQHTDQKAPRYRGKAWTWTRGAAATVDRDFLGWQGRFFMHGLAHWHVIHHYFPKFPFYRAEEGTKYLKEFMGDQYIYDDTPIVLAFWRNWEDCRFVEDTGGILFLKDKKGKSLKRDLPEEEVEAGK